LATFDQIRQALNPIRKLVDQEAHFEIEGVAFTLTRITPVQEIEVIRAFDNPSETTADTLATQDRYRNTLLGYSIVQIGSVDLRADEVDTGDRTPEGKPIRQPKVDAVRQILETLDRNIGIALQARYGEMMEQQEIRVRKATNWNPQDLDIEIGYLKTRIEELEHKKEAVLQVEKERNPVLTAAQQGVAYFRQARPPVPLDEPEDQESSFQDVEPNPAPRVAARAVGLRENP
jgi:hypothetical protein